MLMLKSLKPQSQSYSSFTHKSHKGTSLFSNKLIESPFVHNNNIQNHLFCTLASSSKSKSKKNNSYTEISYELGKYNQHPKKWRQPLTRIKDWSEINREPNIEVSDLQYLNDNNDNETNDNNETNNNNNNNKAKIDIKNIDISSLDSESISKIQKNKLSSQASKCMDCGTPFCHTSYSGCPLNNLIPEWNSLICTNDMHSWSQALQRLQLTNNFPEFTGRVCPAPCEGACVAGITKKDFPVTIKDIEYNIVDYGFTNGLINPRIVNKNKRNNLNIAIIGSGPAGLACADNLNQMGYNVTVYEREDQIGGLLTYGIPNMKLDKTKVKRRVDLLEKEGIKFVTGRHVKSIKKDLDKDEYDAYVLAIGSTVARDLNVRGRELNNIHFAMEFLTANQKRLFMSKNGTIHSAYDESYFINAKNRKVIVIGGGDTGTDCIGTSIRHECKSIINLELLNKPPFLRDDISNPWPEWPKVFRIDYGHEEALHKFGNDPRMYNMNVKEFIGDSNGNVTGLKAVNVEFDKNNNKLIEIDGSEIIIECDLVLLAMGFVSPENDILNDLNLTINGNKTNTNYNTNIDNIFATGDCRRGQSLVVWAISEGRQTASAVDKYFNQKQKAKPL